MFKDNPSRPLNRFLQLHWLCNDGAGIRVLDVAGRYQGASFVNTVAWTSSFTTSARVLNFTSAGYVQVDGVASTNGYACMVCNFTTGSFSWAVWASYPTSFGSSFPGLIAKRGRANGAASTGWFAGIRTDASFVGFPYVEMSDGTNQVNATWGSAKNDSKWHLIVGVVDRTSQLLKLSVDGQAFVTVSCAAVGSVSTTSDVLILGARPDGGGYNVNRYTGRLGSARVWAGYPLTIHDVATLYKEKPFSRTPIPYRKNFFAVPGAPAAASAQQSAVSVIS